MVVIEDVLKSCDPFYKHLSLIVDLRIDRLIDRFTLVGKWVGRFRPHIHCFSTFVPDQNVSTKMGFPEVDLSCSDLFPPTVMELSDV